MEEEYTHHHHHHHHHHHRQLAGKPTRIMRRSIFVFLQNFHHLTSTPSLLAFPFSLSTLLAQTLIPSSTHLFPAVHARLTSLFLAAGFPPSSDLFSVLNLKLAQSLVSFIFVLPFTLSFLLLSKASTIRALSKSPVGPLSYSYTPMLTAHLSGSMLVLSANAACFSLLITLFDVYGILFSSSSRSLLIPSAVGAVVYSIAVANAYVAAGLSVVVAAVEGRGGFGAVLKACVLARGTTGLALAVPVNVALAGVEALFRYRVVRSYSGGLSWAVVAEAVVVAYMYAMLVVLDTVVGCVFLRSCYQEIEIQERSKQDYAFAFQTLL